MRRKKDEDFFEPYPTIIDEELMARQRKSDQWVEGFLYAICFVALGAGVVLAGFLFAVGFELARGVF
ncbi:MAG: hypothetical protein ACE5DW_06825 [Thermodesulfobacteriota bacterium]